MVTRIRNYALVGLAMFAFYYILSHHFIFNVDSIRDVEVLKKSELTLKYTFISEQQSTPAKLLRIDPLREAGYADLLLDRGMITEAKLDAILKKIKSEKDAELED